MGATIGSAIGSIGLASVRDLQWRTRRFFVAAIATGLVFAVALMMSGIANSFSVEVRDTVSAVGAQTWLVRSGSPGPFTDTAAFPTKDASALEGVRGVSAAAPLLVGHALSSGTLGAKDVNVLGVEPGRLGSPQVVQGRRLGNGADVVVDASLQAKVGQVIVLNGSRFKVVGLVSGVTYFAGQPVVFMPIAAADRLDTNGLPLATAILVQGVPKVPITGFTALSDAQVRSDLARPTREAVQTIKLVEILLWLVAAGIIATIIYLSALERRGDFAVLKALGSTTTLLFVGLAAQAVAVSLAAAVIAAILSNFMTGLFAQPVDIPGSAFIVLPLSALVVGLLASLAALRRAASVDPAAAFAGA